MMANVITGLRILVSAVLVFCPVFSRIFYMLYLIAGLSDMADGIIIPSRYAMQKKYVAVHTTMNKVTGVLLFMLPLALGVSSDSTFRR